MQSSAAKSQKNSTFESYRAQRLKTPGHKSNSNLNALKDLQQLEELARSRFQAQTSRHQEEQQSQSLTERKVFNVCSEYGDFGQSRVEGRQTDMEQFKVNFRLPFDQIKGSNSQRESVLNVDQSKSGVKTSNFKTKLASGNSKPQIAKKPTENNNIINRLIKTKSTNIKHKDSKIDKMTDKALASNRNRLSKYLVQMQKLHSQLIQSNLLSNSSDIDSLLKKAMEILTQQVLK